MEERLPPQKKNLLSVEDVASYLGVGLVTIYRWCREGSLPCLKIGRSWRVRREALENFLERSERSETLSGRLRAFLEVPDNVLVVAQSEELLHRLDATFFKVGEARGGMLVKYHRAAGTGVSLKELRVGLERNGLEVSRLEVEGRMRIVSESDPPRRRLEEVRSLTDQESDAGRSVWINFGWEDRIDLEEALRQQEEMTKFVKGRQLVIGTSALEKVLNEWPGKVLRRAQVAHSGTIWLSESGLAVSHITPPPLV